MKPEELTVREIFSNGSRQYWVPRYQRRYSWEEEKLHGLWRDVGSLFLGHKEKNHFMGIILGNAQVNVGRKPAIREEVIDGQQRLTTLLILLAAINAHVKDVSGQKDGKAKKRRTKAPGLYYLPDSDRKATDIRVLELQAGDFEALDLVMHDKWRKEYTRCQQVKVLKAYSYFRYCLWVGSESFEAVEEYKLPMPRNKKDRALASPEELWSKYYLEENSRANVPLTAKDAEKIFGVIQDKMILLKIVTNEADEDSAEIFMSINGKREEFDQWDHAKSYLFRFIPNDDELLDHWDRSQLQLDAAVEESGRRRGNVPVADDYLYNLMILIGSEFNIKANKHRTASQLKEFLLRRHKNKVPSSKDIKTFIAGTILPVADVYALIVSPKRYKLTNERGADLPSQARRCLDQIHSFSKGPADPAIMACLVAWKVGDVDDADLCNALAAIESLLARHFLANRDLSPLRSKFMNIISSTKLAKDGRQRLELLKKSLRENSPEDDEIIKSFKEPRALYSSDAGSAHRVGAILRGIELHLSGEAASHLPIGSGGDEFNVDHVLPQSCREEMNKQWNADCLAWGLSASDVALLQSRVDTLGNLVLHASYANKSDRDASFSAKQKALSGKSAKKSVILRHAQDVCDQQKWTHSEIDERTNSLLKLALKHWSLSA